MKIRIRWSDFERYSPIKLRIKDWANLKILYRNYMIVDSIMDYKGKEIELCVPYRLFISKLRQLKVEEQKAIIEGRANITLMKTYKRDNRGLIIQKVENVGY